MWERHSDTPALRAITTPEFKSLAFRMVVRISWAKSLLDEQSPQKGIPWRGISIRGNPHLGSRSSGSTTAPNPSANVSANSRLKSMAGLFALAITGVSAGGAPVFLVFQVLDAVADNPHQVHVCMAMDLAHGQGIAYLVQRFQGFFL